MQRLSVLALAVGMSLVSTAFAQLPAANEQQAVAPVSAGAFAEANERIIETLDLVSQVDGATPAMAVVMVRRGQAPVLWVHGRLDARASTMANADTPFYIASQTKAYVGLMALDLHARGTFALDQTLADVWPHLTLPGGADPRAITFRALLSHQGIVDNETLEFRTSYTDAVQARDFPRILSNYSTVREPGFAYRNIGYLIYAAALETQTGRDWRDWLDAEILRPARLSRTTSRPSRFAPAELPAYHQWLGGDEWEVYQTKNGAVMHAAGGLVSSPNDMARWLSLQLGEVPGVVAPEILAQSHAVQVTADIQDDVLNCQGYAVGWNICRIGDVDVLAHGGRYTAVRSIMAVSLELGVGFAFMSNSDSMTGGLSQILTQIFFQVVQDQDAFPPEAVQATYGNLVQGLRDERRNAVAETRAQPQWGSWTWRPTRGELRRYAGRYRSQRLGDFVVDFSHGALSARLGAMSGQLAPAQPDLFGLANGPSAASGDVAPLTPFVFERNGRRTAALIWDGERFERVRR
jgi:CubicO group peptidase (beta-lactamase class C family)